MNKITYIKNTFRWKVFWFLLIALALVLAVQGSLILSTALAKSAAAPLAAPPNDIALSVWDISTGEEITNYKFLVNVDNTGDPFNEAGCSPYLPPPDPVPTGYEPVRDPTYPDNCDLPSIRTVPGWAPIYLQGDQTIFNNTTPWTFSPDTKYLVSVMADGYKMGGEHFSTPDEDGIVEVFLHPFPLPPATIVIKVFEDISFTNGQFDAPVEQGLAGFRASLNDIAGEITTDIHGNPLCTTYDEFGDVVTPGTPEDCQISDANGIISIPNIGPMRYDVLMFPPTGEPWIQTTTLEGSQGWDTWLQEAGTGLDNEFLIAAEPFPWTIFGFVRGPGDDPNFPGYEEPAPPSNLPAWRDPLLPVGTGTIQGVIMGASTFVPAKDGLPYIGDTFGGFSGTKIHRPIANSWLSLSSLGAGDTAVWVGQADADGFFSIPNLPAGNYALTYWDEQQHYILDFVQVTVNEGQVSDVGIRMLTGWFTEISGIVFHDENENGICDNCNQEDGEKGLPHFTVVFRDRDNTEIDRMSIASVTEADGSYDLPKGYPMGSWMVLEAYSDLHRTTGVTYKTLNMKDPVTLGPGIVDLGILPVLGQPIRVDWGVVPYGPEENGGIAGTVFYDTMRAEDDARYAGAEPMQPGIPELTLNLYQAQVDGSGNLLLDPDGGAAITGTLLATTVTETFERPKGCQALDVNGDPVNFPPLPPADLDKDCLEGPMMGTQAGSGQNNLDGNWGFGEGCFGPGGYDPLTEACADGNPPSPLIPGDYLVEVVIPNDASGSPMFQVTREEDVNIYDGDVFIPAVPPPACAGALHIVDVALDGIDGYPERSWTDGVNTITVTQSITVENPLYAEIGGQFEGQVKPYCNVKHVQLQNGAAVAPIFNLFTEVPIPGKWKGYLIDNLNVSVDPDTLFFGEMAGIPKAPIGLYDWSGRLVHTMHSDFNGVYEVLLPSNATFNAPSPSGMFANMFYLYANDPGPIGQPNLNYNPQYRSIGTTFEIYPGNIMPSDLAPTQNGAAIWSPGTQFNSLSMCQVNDDDLLTPKTPEMFAVSKPYWRLGSDTDPITIDGNWFSDSITGTAGTLTLGGIPIPADWSSTTITFTLPAGIDFGPQQLMIESANGLETVNGLTFHVLGGNYDPTVYEVGQGKTYDPNDAIYQPPDPLPIGTPPDPYGWPRGPIQHAIDDAFLDRGDALVVVYPGLPVEQINPLGMYIENPVLYAPVKLQGVGPGGTNSSGYHYGSIIDGRAVGGDSPYNQWWRETLLPDIWDNRGGWDRGLEDGDGNPITYEGAVITLFGERSEFKNRFKPAIDGFVIQGGDQQGFPNNIHQVGGGQIPGVQANVVVQGGGIFVDGHGDYLQITNNLIQGNGGSYGGAIRLGTPHIPGNLSDNHNDDIRIAYNRILANGGTNLAGAIALFNGADNYEIADNDICGNSSIEYGGGISHYGWSPGGQIHHNRIYYNSSYDEGGGIMIAGELPADPSLLSTGAGAVDIHHNLIQSNLANDDGGGLRFLMAGGETFSVYNNMIVNNVSTHEGAGVSLNDAPYVSIVNNTIMKNITTATALTSNGLPAPAGLSSSRNSLAMMQSLPAQSPSFSDPVLFNNIFWDNRAGTWDGDAVTGIGLPGDTLDPNYWDLGVSDGSGLLSPQFSLLQTTQGTVIDTNNKVGEDPTVVNAYDTVVGFMPWRGNVNFVGVHITTVDLPGYLEGDYHLAAGSPAIDMGAAAHAGIDAPLDDIDGDLRPVDAVWDSGADEFGGIPLPPNQPPIASFTFECGVPTALDCSFDASTSSDPDGSIVSYSWEFGDLISVETASPIISHTYAVPGSYIVQLTVFDDGTVQASDSTGQEVIASNNTTMHVGDLDSEVIIIRPGQNNERWDAIVTVLVHDSSDLQVDSATVSVEISWFRKNNNNQRSTTVSCITVADGTCQVMRQFNPDNVEDEVTFTVLDVTHASMDYVAGENHDPDGDSDGTTIVVTKP